MLLAVQGSVDPSHALDGTMAVTDVSGALLPA